MCSFLLLILYFTIDFSRADSFNANKNIVDLIKDIKCSFVNDAVAKQLHLDTLCSIPLLKLEDIKIKSNYDSSPLLCAQFYQMNVELCNLIKDKKLNSQDIGLPDDEQKGEEFMKNLQLKYTNITTLCNYTNPSISNLEHFTVKENPVIEYFYKVIGNDTICRRLCTNVVDGNVKDLCKVIMWQLSIKIQHTNLLNVTKDGVEPGTVVKKVTDSSVTKIVDISENPDALQRQLIESKDTSIDVLSNGPQRTIPESVQNPPESVVKKLPTELALENLDGSSKSVVTKSNKVAIELPNNKPEKLDGDVINPENDNQLMEGEFKDNIQKISEPVDDNIDKSIDQENEKDLTYSPQNTVDIDDGIEKPQESGLNAYRGGDRLLENEDSHFFTYFASMGVVCGILYILFHNKKKILALAVEGRRSRTHGGSRRRPNTAAYSKLDCNLEEAMVSNVSQASVTHVLY